jgi:uncharacterized protein YpiB (UPF0302 family)
MAGERTFVVKILGNADGAITAFKKLAREGTDAFEQVQSIGGKIGSAFDVVQKGALVALGALTAVGGAALGAVAAAAADEASQKSLEAQLIRSAGATNAQVQATEAFIEQAMLATGIADDELRPAFGNLARATGDLEKSQRLFTLALDISASTSRDLEAVTLALGRAATGNIGALTRLGIPLDENTKKTKDFGAALLTLEQQFGGAAAVAADTFSGRVKILKTSLGEVVEEIGFALLPTAERLVEFLQKRLLPALQAAADGFREEGLSGALKYFLAALGPFGVKVIDTIEAISLSVITLGGHLDVVAAIIAAGAFVAQPSKALDIFNGILDRSNNAASNASAKFDALRLSIINTGNALNFANNQISPLIDQTDRIGQKVLPKAKESTDDFNEALKKVGGGGGSAPKVKKAVEDVAKSVEATVNVFDELSKALKTVTSQQKSFDAAQKSSLSAKKQLAKSDLSLADAQAQFNQAVKGFGADSVQAKDAQKKLSIANRAVAQAGFRVEDSIFAVQDAEKKLAETRADPDSNPRMIREAEIALEEAKLRVVEAIEAEDEATLARTESQVKLNEVINGAIVGSVVYDSLLKELNEAKDAQTEASERATEAIQNETDAFNDLAEAIRNAAIAQGNIPVAVAPVFRPEEIDKGFSLPTLPTVPAPAGAISSATQVPSGGTQIVVNTGVGTNGIEAGRQIVQLLQQYTAVDAFAIDKLGFAPRR